MHWYALTFSSLRYKQDGKHRKGLFYLSPPLFPHIEKLIYSTRHVSILYLSRRRAAVPTQSITRFCPADQNSSDSQASQRHLQLSIKAPLTVSQFSECKAALGHTAGPVPALSESHAADLTCCWHMWDCKQHWWSWTGSVRRYTTLVQSEAAQRTSEAYLADRPNTFSCLIIGNYDVYRFLVLSGEE